MFVKQEAVNKAGWPIHFKTEI